VRGPRPLITCSARLGTRPGVAYLTKIRNRETFDTVDAGHSVSIASRRPAFVRGRWPCDPPGVEGSPAPAPRSATTSRLPLRRASPGWGLVGMHRGVADGGSPSARECVTYEIATGIGHVGVLNKKRRAGRSDITKLRVLDRHRPTPGPR